MSPEQKPQSGPKDDSREPRDEKATVSYQPLSLRQPETALVRSLWWGNLITFGVVALGAVVLVSWQSALSVLVGGAIALVNFRLLERTITRTLKPQAAPVESPLRRVLTGYYLRLAATALVLLILVRQQLVEPLGLLAGLSVVVVSVLVWGALQARRFWQGRD